MDIKVIEESQKPLLKRKEFSCLVTFEGKTPSRMNLTEEISAKTGCPKSLLVIKHIKSAYGESTAHVLCHCYTSETVMRRLERDNLLKKHQKKAKQTSEPSEEEDKEEPHAQDLSEEEPKKEG